MASIQNKYKVVSNKKLCPRFYDLCMIPIGNSGASKSLPKIQPGQFMHIRVNDELSPFFRRPFSVYRAKKYIEILYEVVGPGTEILSKKGKGDILDVLGPVGHPFNLPPKRVKHVVMVAGGIGVAPFLVLSDILKGKKGYDLTLLFGVNTRGHVYNMKDFKQNGCKVHVATMDGSVGVEGRVSKLFSKIETDPQTTFIYTCGPKPMMRAVQDFAKQHGLSGEASCEETMACALGACLGCSIRTKSGYKTVCYDGPVFDLKEVIF